MVVLENKMFIDGWLKQNLDLAKNMVKKDHDIVLVGDGPEGSGKSVMMMQVAWYLDPTFSLDRVCFNAEEFIKAIKGAKRYQAVLFDEAFRGLSSRQYLSPIMEALIKMFAEIRQKNLFILVVMPCFFELTKYIAIWRSSALIHTYLKKGERGNFAFYGPRAKKRLYLYGKKAYDYSCAYPSFRSKFTKFYVLDEQEYRKKKFNAFQKSISQSIKREQMQKIMWNQYQKEYKQKKRTEKKEKALKGGEV